MFRQRFGQLAVEGDWFSQRIEKALRILLVELYGLVLMNGLLGSRQSTGQDEAADSLAFEGCCALNKAFCALFQAQVNAFIFCDRSIHDMHLIFWGVSSYIMYVIMMPIAKRIG